MRKGVTTEHLKLTGGVTYTDEEVTTLTGMIDRSFKEVNIKFVEQFRSQPTIPKVDLTKIKENKEIYRTFKAMRKEHISYFKKYPEYVHEKLTKQLEKSKETITFHGPEVAKAAYEVAYAQKKVQEKLANDLEMAKDIARRHANFIARDQLGKFTATIHESQAKYVGAMRYIWRTSLDERVRPEHRKREGKTYYYDKPPGDGNPGIPYRCRCSALAIVEFD